MNEPNPEHMNPFREMKLLYIHVFRGFRFVNWRGVISATIAGYMGAFIVLLFSFRLLDGTWDWNTNGIRAAVVAALVGVNIALQGAMRRAGVTMQEELLSKQVKNLEGEAR